jgi:hypothetical protein
LNCVLIILVRLSSPIDATEIIECQTQPTEERINVSSDELLITEHGIFLMKFGQVLPLTAIYADVQGLYIKAPKLEDKIYNTCPNGHEIYHQYCQGCANWWCHFRCKCYSPWSGN